MIRELPSELLRAICRLLDTDPMHTESIMITRHHAVVATYRVDAKGRRHIDPETGQLAFGVDVIPIRHDEPAAAGQQEDKA